MSKCNVDKGTVMTIDTKKLAADIARAMELDAKRTQGKWAVKLYENSCYYEDKHYDGWHLKGPTYAPDYENPMLTEVDAKFAASAPLMADIILQQQEVISLLVPSLSAFVAVMRASIKAMPEAWQVENVARYCDDAEAIVVLAAPLIRKQS
jgi:hypothetical protein